MNEEKITYYCIKKKILGRRTEGKRVIDRIFRKGKWVPDRNHLVRDHLIGYDPFEPEGSPYAIGNLSVMDEIEEISQEKAMELMGLQTIEYLKGKWIRDFREEKKEWDRDPGWAARCVVTRCKLHGVEYEIRPEDLGWNDYGFGEGFMESVQDKMEEDLKAVGAELVISFGFLE